MMYSAYKLNKQGDNIQPWCTPFPIWNQSVVPCPVLTVASWSAYRFLRRQVRWSGIPISFRIFQFVVIHTVNEEKVDVFLEFHCFFYDPVHVGNLIFGSSAFSKSSLCVRNFLFHVLLKPSLKDFEHCFASVWDECNCALVWIFFGISLLWDWNENWLFPVLWPLRSFPICWHIECSIFTASTFWIWNRSAGIPSVPLTMFIVKLPKAHLTLHSRMSGTRWVTIPSRLSGSLRPFLYSSSMYSCHLFLISSASVRSLPFLSFIFIK